MTTHISPNIRFVQHTSEVLRGNPLGDRHVRDFPIWVPPDYDSSPDKRYPVIFGLTGFTGRGVNYLNRRFMFPAHDELLDELFAGGMPGVIYVMPDCLTRLEGWPLSDGGDSGDVGTRCTGLLSDRKAFTSPGWDSA